MELIKSQQQTKYSTVNFNSELNSRQSSVKPNDARSLLYLQYLLTSTVWLAQCEGHRNRKRDRRRQHIRRINTQSAPPVTRTCMRRLCQGRPTEKAG